MGKRTIFSRDETRIGSHRKDVQSGSLVALVGLLSTLCYRRVWAVYRGLHVSQRAKSRRKVTMTNEASLFSIGNLSALYAAVWPECWSTHEVCDKNWISAVTYLQIIGKQISKARKGPWLTSRYHCRTDRGRIRGRLGRTSIRSGPRCIDHDP